jgi:hypothetical protein
MNKLWGSFFLKSLPFVTAKITCGLTSRKGMRFAKAALAAGYQ